MINPRGTLYLIPVPLDESATATIPADTLRILGQLKVLIAERARTTRRWIKVLCPDADLPSITVHELDKHNRDLIDDEWLAPALTGQDIGLLSEAGCPGIADPGSRVVARAMALDIPVIALVGPSAILLALMGSGMNGQSFVFHGYLSPNKGELQKDLQRLERTVLQSGQTQLFIETPYRNKSVYETALEVLQPGTMFGIAAGLTGTDALQRTLPIHGWRKQIPPPLDKVPAVFLLGKT
ncbi:MAG: SAM-dependent methyltransferase [Saprospiraceae bacterium]|nr:SAM-dependent methyltransferase [Saprospiraceae bacterium]